MPNRQLETPQYQSWWERNFCDDLTVRRMNWLQKLLYRCLLQEIFICETQPYAPDDDDVLWILAGAESLEQWQQQKDLIMTKFERFDSDGQKLLRHRRLEHDWDQINAGREERIVEWNSKAPERQEKARAAGKASGLARRRKFKIEDRQNMGDPRSKQLDPNSTEPTMDSAELIATLNTNLNRNKEELYRGMESACEAQPSHRNPGASTPSVTEVIDVRSGINSTHIVSSGEPAGLALRFYDLQGQPAQYREELESWTQRFAQLVDKYGAVSLSAYLEFGFNADDFWPSKLVRYKDHPLDYFESKLEQIKRKYLQRLGEQKAEANSTKENANGRKNSTRITNSSANKQPIDNRHAAEEAKRRMRERFGG